MYQVLRAKHISPHFSRTRKGKNYSSTSPRSQWIELPKSGLFFFFKGWGGRHIVICKILYSKSHQNCKKKWKMWNSSESKLGINYWEMGHKYMILAWSKKHLVGKKPPKVRRLAPVLTEAVVTIKKDNFAKLPPKWFLIRKITSKMSSPSKIRYGVDDLKIFIGPLLHWHPGHATSVHPLRLPRHWIDS